MTDERRPWLTRNLVVLCGVSFLQDAASELLYPIMPIFLTTVLGAPASVVGAVEGLAEAVASLAKVQAGRVADRFDRRRPVVGLGYGLAAAGKLIIAVSFVWPAVLLGRAVDRLGKGIRGAPRDALLVQDVPPEARGRAFGLHRTADTMGAVVGPLIGLAGYEALHHHIRPLLVIAVIPAVGSALLVGAVREDHTAPRRRPVGEAPSDLRQNEPYVRAVTLMTVFGLVNFPDALLLLRVKALGFSVAGVIVVYVVYNAVYALGSYPAGVLTDRFTPPQVYAFGLVCFAVCYIGLGVITDGNWVWPLLVVYGGFTAATDGVGKAWISRLVGTHDQAHAQGMFQGVSGGAVLVAGLWAGLLWHHTGRGPLVFSGVVALAVAGVLLTRFAGTDRRPRTVHR